MSSALLLQFIALPMPGPSQESDLPAEISWPARWKDSVASCRRKGFCAAMTAAGIVVWFRL